VQAVYFFQGFAMNRSIEKLDVNDVVQGSDMFPLLVPFFMNNNSLKTLSVSCKEGGDESLSKIAFALGQFNSLTDFYLFGGSAYYERGASCGVVEALVGHAGLKCLSLGKVPIGRDACTALADFLRNPRVILESLDLFRNAIDDKGADILSSGLIGNQSLTNLNIGRGGFTEIGWLAIFAMLKNPHCRLMSLDLGYTDINDSVAQSLTNALRCNSTLKTLTLRQIHSISTAGWRDLFAGILQGPHCMLEKLDLSDSRGEDPDRMMESLASALAGNVNLKELHLFTCGSATPVGWRILATILRNPSSGLEILDFEQNSINDDIMSTFAMALANNRKLKELDISGRSIRRFTSIGYAAILCLLCDTSTILSTFNSNHTLEYIGWGYREDIKSLLTINQEYSVSQAARIKIINSCWVEM
jgi:Ran GTPase-activating protein (RanGAP) involved in mRNA processing and transport